MRTSNQTRYADRTEIIWQVCPLCGALVPAFEHSFSGGHLRPLCCRLRQTSELAFTFIGLRAKYLQVPGFRS